MYTSTTISVPLTCLGGENSGATIMPRIHSPDVAVAVGLSEREKERERESMEEEEGRDDLN